MQQTRRRGVDALLHLVPPLLSVVLVWPLLADGGYPLARDLVFVPDHAWTPAAVGLGDGPPRAVPLDAVMAALTVVVDGGVLARVVIPVVLAAAGWGVLRVLRDAGAVARASAAGFAVWNPFVVERLALGQWALLAGYAALPWLLLAAARYRRSGRGADLGAAVLWAALASLTPTGGLLAMGALVAGGAARTRRAAALVGTGAALQAPWVVAAFAGAAGRTSDPAAVSVFAPDTDGPGGPVVALLGLGGIWDDLAEPATRGTWIGVVAAAATVAVLVAGHGRLRVLAGDGLTRRWSALAVLGAGVAIGAAVPWGQDALRWAVAEVPGAGLLRDGQKFLAPAVLLVAATLGALVQRVADALADRPHELRVSALLPLVTLPVVLLPDATTVTWPVMAPVDHPDDMEVIAAEVAAGPDDAVLVTLPWRSYRLFTWGTDRTASDPALRWFEADVVTSDDLQVGELLVRGEGALAADVGEALREAAPAEVLGPLGVRWVVVYADDPEVWSLDLAGLEPVHQGQLVQLFRVPDPVADPRDPSTARRVVVALGWATGSAAVLLGMLAVVVPRLRDRSRRRTLTP